MKKENFRERKEAPITLSKNREDQRATTLDCSSPLLFSFNFVMKYWMVNLFRIVLFISMILIIDFLF